MTNDFNPEYPKSDDRIMKIRHTKLVKMGYSRSSAWFMLYEDSDNQDMLEELDNLD